MTKNQDSTQQAQNITPIIILAITIAGLIFLFFSRGSESQTQDIDLRGEISTLDEASLENDLEFMPDSNSQSSYQENETTPQTSIDQDTNQSEQTTMINKTQMPKPEMTISQSQQYIAKIDTNFGLITAELFAQETPVTVNNFVYLAQAGFFDDLIFHRVINDFMIQGGCPLGNGTGNPGYQFQDESNPQPLVKGSLAMANSGPNTNGSQFFIVTADSTPWLDGLHTHFGKVIEGMDVVEQIESVQTGANDRPTQPVVIRTISIETN
ncbi:MAG: peptidylprolyl isomerase [Microgenomates bacterium 39_7]|nr:MAG: peptidylprolyl isomerase [Microgenomates bacterium 39_7]